MSYYVYMLKSQSGKSVTYVGYTKNIKERLVLHNSGKGAKFTRGRTWKLIYKEIFKSKNKPKAINCSLSKVAEIKRNISIPIVGIGGINLKNQRHAYQAGCNSVAMIDGLFME